MSKEGGLEQARKSGWEPMVFPRRSRALDCVCPDPTINMVDVLPFRQPQREKRRRGESPLHDNVEYIICRLVLFLLAGMAE